MFGQSADRPTVIEIGDPEQTGYILQLYRSFDVDVDSLEKLGPYLILSPKQGEQGLIWFTHNLIRMYDPKEYVRGRGSHLLTYPLHCIRHFQTIYFSDGTTSTRVPAQILELTEPTENCHYHMGIELPSGWVFSYKHEKFVCCSTKIRITPDMLQPVEAAE